MIAGVLSRVLRCRSAGRPSTRAACCPVQVGAAHASLIMSVRPMSPKAHVHAYLREHHHGACVLTDRAVTLGTHAGVGQDLRQCVLGGR